jgi:polar amino acid transport system permease protein
MSYSWDFSVLARNWPLLLEGLRATVELTVVSLAIALPVGLVAALLRLSHRRALAVFAGGFIAVFRSTPPLVQLFWAFYALPLLIGVRFAPFTAAVLMLSLQSAAFFAEVFRGGIVSIERGQWEAGRAIGMTRTALMRRIILPQAVRRMIPAFMERVIELMKTTSLVSSIAFADLLYQAMVLSTSTYRPLEIFSAAALLYFIVLFSLSLAMRGVEARLARAQ